MGPADDPMAVVDTEGRVYGVENLRVVDASIFPTGPRANLHCTVTAVAERIADLIQDRSTPGRGTAATFERRMDSAG